MQFKAQLDSSEKKAKCGLSHIKITSVFKEDNVRE